MKLRDARLAAARLKPGHTVSNVTLGELLDEYFEDHIRQTYRRPRQVRLYIDRVPDELKALKLREVTRADVRHFLRDYAKGAPVGANRLLAIMKQAFKFGIEAGYVDVSPIEQMTRKVVGGKESSRDRVLSDDEIRLLWAVDADHGPLLRFLLLTGQRIGEAQRATWAHIEGDRWTIPAEHAKNKREHWVALPRQAHTLLAGLPTDRDKVFGKTTNTNVQAWLRRWCDRNNVSPRFTPHDLRRTFTTRLNDLGAAPHVVEKVLGHTMQGVMAVYNRAEYEHERRDAMQRWADEIERLTRYE